MYIIITIGLFIICAEISYSLKVAIKSDIFATSNNIENLINLIFDRFDNFNITPYTIDQIYLIDEAKLKHKIQDPMLIRKIIEGAFIDLKTKNIRDILYIAKVCKTESDVEKYITAKHKYS